MLNIYALDQGKFYGACSISKGMYLCMAYWSSQARYIGNGVRTNNWVMDALISDINVPNTAALCKRGCLLYYLFIYFFFFFAMAAVILVLFFFSVSLYFVIEVPKRKWLPKSLMLILHLLQGFIIIIIIIIIVYQVTMRSNFLI